MRGAHPITAAARLQDIWERAGRHHGFSSGEPIEDGRMRRRFFVVAVAALVAGCAGSAATLAPGVPSSDAVASGQGTAVSAPPFPTSPSSSFAGGSPVPGGSNALAAVTKTMDDLKATALEAEIHVGGRPDW